MGWYDTNDNSGGQNFELRFDGLDDEGNAKYTDERKKRKYYETSENGTEEGYLFGYQPQYS